MNILNFLDDAYYGSGEGSIEKGPRDTQRDIGAGA